MRSGKHYRNNRRSSSFFSLPVICGIAAALLLVCLLTFGRGFLFRTLGSCGLCPHSWQDGTCTRCGRICAHGTWRSGICSECGEICPHRFDTDGICASCGTSCSHEWADGFCNLCGMSCIHDWEDGICKVCRMSCHHDFSDGVCSLCGLVCSHSWQDGVCDLCGKVCSHPSHDPDTLLCPVCGEYITHRRMAGVCSLCGKEMPFVTSALPEDIFTVSEPGTLYEAHYLTKNYPYEDRTGLSSESVEKNMLVYLPADYDPEKKYDVLFLLHGNYGCEYDWLGNRNMLRDRETCGKEILDGIIEHGYCEPLLVVSLCYYTDTSEDGLICGEEQFTKEMLQDILPRVTQYFGTWAEDSSLEAVAASRDHFGIVGLSSGALYTLSLEATAPELFAWFGCFSGNGGTKAVAEAVNSSGLNIGYFITGAGSDDSQRTNVENEFVWIQESTDKIRDGENAACLIIENCGHSWTCWYTMLYNTLLVFFRE